MNNYYLLSPTITQEQNVAKKLVTLFIVNLIFAGSLVKLPISIAIAGGIFLLMQLYRNWHAFKTLTITSLNLHKKRPYHLLKAVGFLCGLILIYQSHRTFTGVEAGISFLWVCLILKTVEIEQSRDRYITLFFALFVVICLFLLGQSLPIFIVVFCSLILIFSGLIFEGSLTPIKAHSISSLFAFLKRNLWQVLKLVGLAFPVIIVFFIFFPRFPPLWSLPTKEEIAKTGITDRIRPGDIAQLGQSNELAFKVRFNNGQPARKDMYWRGVTLGYFDGTEWQALPESTTRQILWTGTRQFPQWAQDLVPAKKPKRSYQVWLQPSENPWIFTLNFPWSYSENLGIRSDYTTFLPSIISHETSLHLFQVSLAKAAPNMNVREQAYWSLSIPGNLESKLFAKRLFQRVQSNPHQYIKAILLWFRQQNFSYTLSPKKLTENRIDSFLFQTREGYCEHYASAFVALMRNVGIPSRVVVGYQGGQKNLETGLWEVRQSDAHAWAEVWIKNAGWIRIDPTMAIAPQRINLGMETFATTESRVFGEGIKGSVLYQKFKIVQRLRQVGNRLEQGWQLHIVDYTQNRQNSQLNQWFKSDIGSIQTLILIGMLITLMLSMLVWLKFSGRSAADPIHKLLNQLEKQLIKLDIHFKRDSFEGIVHWLNRLEHRKLQHSLLHEIAEQYQEIIYGPTISMIQKKAVEAALIQNLKKWLRQLRK